MRISDWSSDVCSSDLLDRRPFLAIVTAVLLFALVVERLGLVPPVVLCMVAAYAGQVRSRYVFFAVYAFVFGFGTWVLFSRSEEHTSELQSLMRISYAVFCLNKKIIVQKRCIMTSTDDTT